HPTECDACGVSKSDRGQRIDEAIVIMRRLLQEDRVTHEGVFFTCHDVSITPKPFLQPSPPVWIGGRTAAAAKRVGRVGGGWLVSSVTPHEVRRGRDLVFATAAHHHPTIEADHLGLLLSYSIAPDDQNAVATAA